MPSFSMSRLPITYVRLHSNPSGDILMQGNAALDTVLRLAYELRLQLAT